MVHDFLHQQYVMIISQGLVPDFLAHTSVEANYEVLAPEILVEVGQKRLGKSLVFVHRPLYYIFSTWMPRKVVTGSKWVITPIYHIYK